MQCHHILARILFCFKNILLKKIINSMHQLIFMKIFCDYINMYNIVVSNLVYKDFKSIILVGINFVK